MSRELTVTMRLSANEGEALRRAMRYATHPSNTDDWAHSTRERRYAEAALSKVMEVMDRWERSVTKPLVRRRDKRPAQVCSNGSIEHD